MRTRRLVPLVSAVLGIEGALYSAVAPLLASYSHSLHLSRGAAGVLVATYSAGLIVGSILAARLIDAFGPRRTIVLGLAGLAASSLAFGLAGSIGALDGFRAAQGCAAGFLWAGGLAWLTGVGGAERRGSMIGAALSAGVFGTLLGPVLGTLAVLVGAGWVFAAAGAGLAAMGFVVARAGAGDQGAPERGVSLRAALRQPPVRGGIWLVLLPAAAVSVASTLVPLRMASLGASSFAVGVTFILALGLATVAAARLGRLIDGLRPARVATLALTVTAACLAALLLPGSAWLVAILMILFTGAALGACATPAMTLLSEAGERAGLSLGSVAMLLNLSFALGETAGAAAGARFAQLTSDELPCAVLAALALATAWRLAQGRELTREAPAP